MKNYILIPLCSFRLYKMEDTEDLEVEDWKPELPILHINSGDFISKQVSSSFDIKTETPYEAVKVKTEIVEVVVKTEIPEEISNSNLENFQSNIDPLNIEPKGNTEKSEISESYHKHHRGCNCYYGFCKMCNKHFNNINDHKIRFHKMCQYCQKSFHIYELNAHVKLFHPETISPNLELNDPLNIEPTEDSTMKSYYDSMIKHNGRGGHFRQKFPPSDF